ncbi:MAG: hypothetical protein APF76_15785 [Desulfitibacter sp. BRH_c19]|nr:MAG: hypothetical protein APF76_15785 [Desulfitibacter sp. BRH_c19]
MDKIIMADMEFWGFHGVLPEEQLNGQPFIVDVTLWLDLEKVGYSDDLQETVHYGELYDRIKYIVEQKRFDLIEALTRNIIDEVFMERKITKTLVRVKKPLAPIKGKFKYMAVEMERER